MTSQDPIAEAFEAFKRLAQELIELFFFCIQVIINVSLLSYVGLKTGNVLIDNIVSVAIYLLSFYIGIRLSDAIVASFKFPMEVSGGRWLGPFVILLALGVCLIVGRWVTLTLPIFVNGIVVSTNA